MAGFTCMFRDAPLKTGAGGCDRRVAAQIRDGGLRRALLP